jgi:hypothetical protein
MRLLVGTLAAIYFMLGVTALGLLGLLAIAGAGAIVAALWQATRSRTTATVLLVAGAVPFAVAAWWSVVAPLTGLVVLAIGIPLVRRGAPRHLHPAAAARRVEPATRST